MHLLRLFWIAIVSWKRRNDDDSVFQPHCGSTHAARRSRTRRAAIHPTTCRMSPSRRIGAAPRAKLTGCPAWTNPPSMPCMPNTCSNAHGRAQNPRRETMRGRCWRTYGIVESCPTHRTRGKPPRQDLAEANANRAEVDKDLALAPELAFVHSAFGCHLLARGEFGTSEHELLLECPGPSSCPAVESC